MGNFRYFVAAAAVTGALMLGNASPLTAEEPAARALSVWSHDLSGLTLPVTLAGFERGSSKQFDDAGYNVGVTFRDNATGSWADLYIYRAAPASVAIWGDRAAAGMFANPMLGEVDVNAVQVARFTPPGNAGANSGLRIVTPVKGELTASGLAIYVHDGWLVKLRMSSRTLDAAALDARMVEFVAGLTLPVATQPAPPFLEIQNCAAPLKTEKKAKLIQLDMMGTILLGGTLGVAHEKRLEEAKQSASNTNPDAVWCRDPASQPQYGIYRRGGDEDGYMMALGDTGTSLMVGRYDLGPLLKPSQGFLVTQSDGVREVIYPPFSRLPQPAQALGLPGSVGPVFSAGLLPGDTEKTINIQTE
jgi:hypothetical protein